MQTAKALWTRLFDVREGEWAVASSMSLYLMFVMFAYYVLKPVSNAIFLTELKVDKLPLLNILIAAVGGGLAYSYSKFAARTSLGKAVAATMAISAVCLLIFWATIQTTRHKWLIYAFNIWVSLFGAIIISQAWVVAGNLFDSRTAKRVYGILGLGAVVGGAFGGVLTNFTARIIGTRNLLLAAAVLLVFAYGSCRFALSRSREVLAASAGGKREDFRMREVITPIVRSRHLQLIVAIYGLGLVVSILSDYQYKSLATRVYTGNELAAFFGRVQGIYVPLITIPLQFFLTAPVLRRLGLGGTLAIMPTGVTAASMAIIGMPGIGSAVACELVESSARYTVNRTGLELLYLPHPARVRNRVKGFVDVLVDRVSRGLGGALLLALFAMGLKDVRQVAAVSIGICALWLMLCTVAQREYVKTIRERLNRRRLDLEESPLNVSDPQVVAMLEQTAETGTPRAARYALSVLAGAPRYRPGPLLRRLSANPSDEVRTKVFELALSANVPDLEDAAVEEIRNATPSRSDGVIEAAVRYSLTFAPDSAGMARTLIAHSNPAVCEAAVRHLRARPAAAKAALSPDWMVETATSQEAVKRRLAALAIGARGDVQPPRLPSLLQDKDPKVAAAAFYSAALLADRALVPIIVDRLGDPDLRRDAVEALAAFGAEIVGTLGDTLQDESVPYAVRVQLPRVIRRIPKQRSVDVLLQALDHAPLPTRAPILIALNKLRAVAPNLNYGPEFIARHVFAEARRYFELHAAMEPVASHMDAKTATGLLARTLESRAQDTVERVFRLLGLRYPPTEIQTVYRSLRKRIAAEEAGAALELLENTLEHSLRRVVLPLVDSPVRAVEKGRELFDIKPGSPEAALRRLIQSHDPWLVACAVAAAAEHGFTSLAHDIESAARQSGPEVAAVAKSALAVLGAASARQPAP